MDEIDRAQPHIEMETERLIKAARQHKPVAAATGECLFCGEEVNEGVRWCSPECRDDWEMRRG